MHYHKTGHDASRAIASALGDVLRVTFADVMSRPSGAAATCLDLVAGAPWQSCFGVQASPDLLCRPFPRHLRIVHFVREPIEMIISALLYHSQQPPPEGWVLTRRPCPAAAAASSSSATMPLTPSLRRFAATVGVPLSDLSAVAALCHTLQPANASFHHAIRTLPRPAAARLVAAWLLLSQGDLLRMGANAMSYVTTRSKPGPSQRVPY